MSCTASHAGFARLRLAEFELAGQRHHQRAHRHRVHEGVGVARLQAHQADQGAGVALDRVGNLVDQGQAVLVVEGLAHAGVLEHRLHGLARLGQDPPRTGQFVLERCRNLTDRLGRRRRRREHRLRQIAEIRGRQLNVVDHLHVHVPPLVGVDDHLTDGPELTNLILVRHLEGATPKRVLQPRAAHLVDVHANAQGIGGNLSEHGQM